MRTPLRLLLNLAIGAGCLLMLWPLGQAAYGFWSQRALHADWEKAAAQVRATPSAPSTSSASAARPRRQKAEPKVAEWPATRLIIPEIGVDTVVLQGWSDDVLRRAPGHAPSTAPPGTGNCVIAAHRNVYGAWFRRLDALLPGSLIQLKTPHETITYRVAFTYNISDTDTTILQQPAANEPARLTLLTCTLPHTSARLVTMAMREEPRDF